MTYHSNGNSAALVNPVLLILGIPVGYSAPTLSIGSTSGFTVPPTSIQAGGPNVYGGSWNTSTGAAGTYGSSAGNNDVYQYLGLNSPGGSQNYPNWSGNGLGFTAWNLFVYSITFNPNMTTGSWAQFMGSLPVGTYVIGYGCESTSTTQNGNKPPPGPCATNGTTQGTPFTFAGLVTQVPEPASLSLLLPGAAVLFFVRRRRQNAR